MNATRAFALFAYLIAQVGMLAWTAWYFWLGTGHEPLLSPLPAPWPWVVDLGLVALFAVQHSGMARAGWKRLWQRVVPPHLERVVYGGTSGLLVGLIALLWQPLDHGTLWQGPLWLLALPVLALLTSMKISARDQARFFGLAQALHPEQVLPQEELYLGGPYRWVRHPLMSCMLVLLWAQPVMSVTLAVLAAGLTAYIAVGLVFEERDLCRRFPGYAEYRRRVPALIPWRGALPAGWTPLASALSEGYTARA
jgi:protein-S-isoprenylcysteine O-methyltransferase Ste14